MTVFRKIWEPLNWKYYFIFKVIIISTHPTLQQPVLLNHARFDMSFYGCNQRQ